MDFACQICCDAYTTSGLHRPRVLPCGHTLCGVCVTRLVTSGQILCPICQKSSMYQDLDKIIINRELEDAIDSLSSASLSSTESADRRPGTIPREVPTATGPKLNYGVCEEHGNYNVHYCVTHAVYICSDCAVAYHMDGSCRRVPIKTLLHNKRANLCEKMDSSLSSLQVAGCQINHFEDVCKSTIEKLQADIKGLEKQLNECQMLASRYPALKKQAQFSRDTVQNAETITELDHEIKNVESSEFNTQEWTDQVKDMVKQSLVKLLTSDAFATIVKYRDTYATCTHQGQQRWIQIMCSDGHLLMHGFRSTEPSTEALIINSFCDIMTLETLVGLLLCREVYATHSQENHQRWGRILARGDYLLMQDFRSDQQPTGAIVFNIRAVTEHLSSPRHVYLRFSSMGISLGMIVIRVNEGAPQRSHQLIDLCIGQKGTRYSGSTAMYVEWPGKEKERFYFTHYLNTYNENSKKSLFPGLEQTGPINLKRGLVVHCGADDAGFRIITRNDHPGTWDGPAIGVVVTGLPVLEKIIRDNLVGDNPSKSKVIITESGLVIGSYKK